MTEITGSENLTPKQSAFVEAYIANGHNGAAAYISAGYKASNQSVSTSGASRMLTLPDIVTAIARRTDSQREQHDIDLGWLTVRYKRIFTQSMTAGEYTSARQALDSIAKQHGLAGDVHSVIDVKHSGAVALASLPLETLSQLLDAIDQQTTMLSIEAPVSEDSKDSTA
jgi:phage terminase small subunit